MATVCYFPLANWAPKAKKRDPSSTKSRSTVEYCTSASGRIGTGSTPVIRSLASGWPIAAHPGLFIPSEVEESNYYIQ